jgi:hypothetical protein
MTFLLIGGVSLLGFTEGEPDVSAAVAAVMMLAANAAWSG